MANELSKQEYLKRYLENDKDSERKRKKKLRTAKIKKNVPCLKIVDQDIDLKSITFGDGEEDVLDEAPMLVEEIETRPIEDELNELYESSRWKKLDSDGTASHSAVTSERSFKSSHGSPSKHSRMRHNSDSDASLSETEKQSRRSRRHDSDSDFSPPRHEISNTSGRHDSDSDTSHRPKKVVVKSERHNSDSDISPPRQLLNKSTRHNSDSDISPPRRESFKKAVSHVENKGRRRDSDSDISPPRHQTVNRSKSQKESSYKQYDSVSDERRYKKSSPVRLKSNRNRNEGRNSDSDISPPRSSSARNASEGSSKRLNKTLSGLKAGLQNSKALQKEVQEMRNKEKSQLSMIDDEISGRNAETIVRDRRTGRKRDLNKEQEAEAEKNEKTRKYEEKYNKWGKGIEQTQDKMEKIRDEMYEMSKPLARYKDDGDLDEHLKSVIYDGEDPMAEYMKKKTKKNVPDFPVYTGPPAPPNRFGIKPGYRWDGVERSNGFEKKYFEKINTTKAAQEEAYLWSVQDM